MTDRANPFAPEALPAFAPKPKPQKPVDREALEKVALENNFPSRQPLKPKPHQRQTLRRRRTGRNQQINIKTTSATIEKLYRLADERKVPLGELLELALDLYEKGSKGGDAA